MLSPCTPYEPPLKVEQFESLQCNFGALPRDGPEAVYHRSAGESLSDVPTPPPPHTHSPAAAIEW